MNLPQQFLYGTAYYRPTNPPRQEHRQHLKTIKHDLGFDIVRLRVQWNPIHREPEHFDFAELDEIVDACDEEGVRALLEIDLQTAPYWLEEADPESRYVNAFGQPIELGSNESNQCGGYPGLCFHNSAVVRAGERYLQEVAHHFQHRKSVVGYDCWNEPHLEPAWISTWGSMGEKLFCYCRESREAFRRWLAQRYGTIEKLNDTWGRAFRDWRDARPPTRLGHYADWLDWGRFWHDELREHMRWRYRVLRAADAGRFIMSHSGAVPPFLARPNAFIHNWKLAEPVDGWGTSFAPLYHNWNLAECAGTIDATRSAARGKPFWISEMSGGACYVRAFRRGPLPTRRNYQTWNWLSVCYGSKATIHWCYLEERTGPESGGFGLVRANGEITERARAAAETAAVLRRHSPLFFHYQPKPQVGILFDPDNSMQLFAMEAADELHGNSHIGYYRAVWQSDNYAQYVTYDSLEDLVGLKLLIVPMCLTLPEQVARAIAEFVRNGGVLIAEARTGHYDERGFNQPTLPAAGLADVIGAVEEEALCSDPANRPLLNNPDQRPWPDPIYGGPMIHFTDPVTAEIRTQEFFVSLRCRTAEPIATSMGHCLATRNQHGQGTAYYIGTYLGLALERGDPGAMKLVLAWFSRHTHPSVRGQRLRPRLIDGKTGGLLAVFNDSRTETISEVIILPNAFVRATNVYDGKQLPLKDNRCAVTVEPEGVCVFELTR